MRARLVLLVAVAAAVRSAAAEPPESPPRQARLDELRRVLDDGLWNNRINALYDLGEMRRDALPLLVYSVDDADWQVRLTAVHFLGKLGPAAAPDLGRIVADEPCPFVRVSALRWLQGMGETGEAELRAVLTRDDAEELGRIPDRYGTERMGKPLVVDAPDGMNADFFNGGADLRVCASSERAGRRRREYDPVTGEELGRSRPEVFAPVVTAPVPPKKAAPVAASSAGAPGALAGAAGLPARVEFRSPEPKTPEQRRLGAELDALLAPEAPQAMPPRGPGPAPRASPSAPAFAGLPARARPPDAIDSSALAPPREAFPAGPPAPVGEEADPVALAFAGLPARARPSDAIDSSAPAPPRESFPAGPPAPFREDAAPSAPAFAPDAGTGKPENDPIPGLIKQLSSRDARRRARAADELGKRGAAAAPAIPALRRALSDRDRRARASAVLALGNVGASAGGVVADLRRALRDKDEDVRFSAEIALERIGRKR